VRRKKYVFYKNYLLKDDLIKSLRDKPSILERNTIVERILNQIVDFVDTFINGTEPGKRYS